MDLLHIKIENFRTLKSADIDLTKFNSALVIAKNLVDSDMSNACGKSTFFWAIVYVLFGEYKSKTISRIVRNGTDKAIVTLDFSVNDQIWRIERSFNKKTKKSDLKIWEKIGEEFISKNQKTPSENDQLLFKLIKISYKAFKNSSLFSQADLDGIASAKDGDKRSALLKDALILLDYSKLEKLAAAEVTDCNKKISEKKTLILELGDPKKDIEESNAKIAEIKASIFSLEKEQNDLLPRLLNKKAELLDLQKFSSNDVKLLTGKISEISVTKNQIQSSLNKLVQRRGEKSSELHILTQKLKNQEAILIKGQTDLENLKLKNLRPIATVREDLEKTSKNEANGNVYLTTVRNKIAELKLPIPNGGVCNHCRQVITDDYRTHVEDENKKEIEKLSKDLIEKKSILDKIALKKSSLQQEIEDCNLHVNKIASLESKIENFNRDIENTKLILTSIQEAINHLESEISSYSISLKEIEERITSLKKEAENLSVNSALSKIEEVKTEIEQLENKNSKLGKDISSNNTLLGVFLGKIQLREQDQQKIDLLKSELKELEKNLKIKQLVVESYSPTGIPTMIIQTILDDLQIQSNKFLSQIRPGLEVQFTPELDVIFRINGEEFDYADLSGGQEMMIALAFRLGLALVLRDRLGINIKFLILDEVDERLDRAASNAFSNIIKSLQDSFKVFVITHNDRLKDRFNQAILVEQGPDGSNVKLVNSW